MQSVVKGVIMKDRNQTDHLIIAPVAAWLADGVCSNRTMFVLHSKSGSLAFS